MRGSYSGNIKVQRAALVQLVERYPSKLEVNGSRPLRRSVYFLFHLSIFSNNCLTVKSHLLCLILLSECIIIRQFAGCDIIDE